MLPYVSWQIPTRSGGDNADGEEGEGGGSGEGDAGGDEGGSGDRSGKGEDPMKDFVVPLNGRTMHERELEAEVEERRRKQEQRLPAVIEQVNDLIRDPKKKIPIEPSQFKPPVLQWLIRDSV